MAVLQAKTKAIDALIVTLDTPAELSEALEAAVTVGYWGHIDAGASPADPQTVTRTLTLNKNGLPEPIVATMGQRLVWYEVWQRIDVVTAEQVATNFDITPQ